MATPLRRARPRRQWIGVAISFCGVFLIATHGDRRRGCSFNIGDLMALASMMMWAGYTILLRVRRDPLETIELLGMVCVFGLVFMTPWVAWKLVHNTPAPSTAGAPRAHRRSFVAARLRGWSYVVKRLGACAPASRMHLMPAFGVVLSAIFLGEYPLWFHFAGIALILAGVTLSSLKASSVSNNQ